MSNELEPIEGNWYYHADKDSEFMVLAVNEFEKTVDVQYFDGSVEEIEMEEWAELELELTDPPEDWSGPLDDVDLDDSGYDD